MSRRYDDNTGRDKKSHRIFFSILSPLQGLTQAYQKILMLPKPDYGHRYSLWKEFIVSKGGKIMRWSDR